MSVAAAREGGTVRLSWTGGTGPFTVLTTKNLAQPNWSVLLTTGDRTLAMPTTNAAQYYQIRR